MNLPMLFSDPMVTRVLLWSAATIGIYLVIKALYRRWPRWWLMPLTTTPVLLIGMVLAVHASYRDYIGGAGWLVTLLGPATVAFAVPIYEERALIRRHWPVLVAGMVTGTTASILAGWGLATLLQVDDTLRLSLLPRSISTPFAMAMSQDIGGAPALTAVFVVLTGVLGASLGEFMLARLPLCSSLARGALMGVAAHAVGTAKAHQIGHEEGSISGLVMVLVGLANVLVTPFVAGWLH